MDVEDYSINYKKNIIRKKIYEKREKITLEDKQRYEEQIFEKIKKNKRIYFSEDVLIYNSTNHEIDTKRIIEYLLRLGKNVYLPYITKRKGIMNFYKIEDMDNLERNQFGIYEPKPKPENLFYKKHGNIISITPLLCTDALKNRLGYGGGYYDRFLLKNPNIISIGLCYDFFIFKKLPRGKYDIDCDEIITN